MSATTATTLLRSLLTNPHPSFGERFGVSPIWPETRRSGLAMRSRPSGNASLDALLPGGGWPLGGLTEILVEQPDGSELELLLPALAALTRARRRVAIIGSPTPLDHARLTAAGIDLAHVVLVDAIVSDSHWNAEQHLRAGGCSAVVLWQLHADYRQLRRLHCAAETGTTLAFVFQPASTMGQPSPAALRLKISRGESGSSIEVLKCRGILNA